MLRKESTCYRAIGWKTPAILALVLLLGLPALGDIAASFEQFSDGQIVTNQIPGLTFTNTIVLTAGVSLDEFEFPPHSGSNVASDNGGPISISFSTPVSYFSGYFTYLEPLTVDGFDAGNTLLASANSQFSSNLALSGDPGSSPNEFISITSPLGISEITITGDPNGGSFTMDDISAVSPVPEPRMLGLLSVMTVAVAVASRLRKA